MIKVGSDFSGIGAFNQALNRLGIPHKHVFACDMDKFARQSYIANYGEPDYFPENVYDREIPEESLDIYMTSPPCQAFSLAGKRKGESDKRGVLFYNSHEFIQKNKPRYFIFENVKGLLSDDNGRTFQRWLDYLGGKSVNGNPVIFPHKESVNYHVYYKVLNAKHYGVPQNRERVFIVGIRDDADNKFCWPKPFPLEKRLKDVLESNVDEKYFLSDLAIDKLLKNNEDINHLSIDNVAKTLRVGGGGSTSKKHSYDVINVGNVNPSGNGMNGNVFDENGISPTLTTNKGEGIKIKSATKSGYETATENDSINFSNPNSETRRGRVGKGVAQTLDTGCNQGIIQLNNPTHSNDRIYDEKGISPTLNTMQGGNRQPFVRIGAIRGRNPDNPNDRTAGLPTQQRLEINQNGTSNALTTVQKDNVVVQLNPSKESGGKQPYQQNRVYADYGVMTTLDTDSGRKSVYTDYKIRRLTPRECLRLMDFPDTFKIVCSNRQTYKQAGNSIVVNVLYLIIKNLLI